MSQPPLDGVSDGLAPPPGAGDPALEEVRSAWLRADPDGRRMAQALRATFDQLYDGQHTGRFRWEQLFKTEKTHFGTLIEINLRRAFNDLIDDGRLLDYRIAGVEVDCKYSQKLGAWMVPPEALGELLLVITAHDESSTFNAGLVRALPELLSSGSNRDAKRTLNPAGRASIAWLVREGELPPNVLLRQSPETLEAIFSAGSGQACLNELFRQVQCQRISRTVVATVAQQSDFMKRVRANGGSRTTLQKEGYLIPGGDYLEHQRVARELGAVVPHPGEMVSLRVEPVPGSEAANAGVGTHPRFGQVYLDDQWWRLRAPESNEPVVPAPELPSTKAAR